MSHYENTTIQYNGTLYGCKKAVDEKNVIVLLFLLETDNVCTR